MVVLSFGFDLQNEPDLLRSIILSSFVVYWREGSKEVAATKKNRQQAETTWKRERKGTKREFGGSQSKGKFVTPTWCVSKL